MAHTAAISPFFRSPFTDITGGLCSNQNTPGARCAQIEMEMMECLEIFGLDRGITRCKCMIADYNECMGRFKQFSRFAAMRAQRDKEIAAGRLKGECKYMTPRLDSF